MGTRGQPAGRSWSRVDDAVEIVVPAGTFAPLEANVVARALERWGLADVAEIDVDRELRQVLPNELWSRLGAPPEDPDRRQEWRDDHQVFALLAGLTRQSLRLESVGFLGGPSTQFVILVEGQRIDAASPTPLARDSEGHGVPLLPAAWEIVRRLSDGVEGKLASRAAQLAWLGSLRRCAADIADALGDGSVVLEEDEHLKSVAVRMPARYKLSWEPREKDANLLDLRLYVANEAKPLDLFALDAAQPIIQRDGENVVLDATTASVARIAQKQRGKLRERLGEALTNPAAIIPEGLTLDHFDLDAYSDRVLGFEPAAPPEASSRESSGITWFTEDERLAFLCLDIRRSDGTTTRVEIPTVEDARKLREAVRAQLDRPGGAGEGTPRVEVDGREVPASINVAEALDVAIVRHDAEARAGRPSEALASPRQRLVVVLEESAAVPEGEIVVDQSLVPWAELDRLLQPGRALKRHQHKGVAWLWSHFTGGTPRGVLLADDMGMGKTLQIACLLALRRAASDRPRRPSLVVAPVILLDNWRTELEDFFVASAFPKVAVLHGATLSRFRKADGSVDDVALAECDLVLTNYDTLQAYQKSLLRIDWAIVALDEAHNIKNPAAYRSRAARGLKREFAIAATGTPVENKLSDLWSIFDFASPGMPFTNLEPFRRTYEVAGTTGIQSLREHLRYPHATSKVLRRTKETLRDLRPKESHVRFVEMTPEQVTIEQSIVRKAKEHGPLGVLQGLQKLYQHPALLLAEKGDRRGSADIDIDRAIATSPKLRLCLEVLEDVRALGEKALVFTLWRDMQDLLVGAIQRRFDIRVPIINGDPANRERAKMRIAELGRAAGFGVMVLSPIAAGTGLNIQCANHVLHYGRWWNPAKEDQATDRAHRLGQDRTVHVHHLLMHWPGDRNRGFDIRLHELVEKKRAVARQFLAPDASQEVSAQELEEILTEGQSGAGNGSD
jgi:hypothetical protein